MDYKTKNKKSTRNLKSVDLHRKTRKQRNSEDEFERDEDYFARSELEAEAERA